MVSGRKKTQIPFWSWGSYGKTSCSFLFFFFLYLTCLQWNAMKPCEKPSIFNPEKTNICLSSPLSLTVFFLSEMSSLDQRSPLWSPATVPEDLHAFWRTRSPISHTLYQYSYSCDFRRVWKPRLDKVSLALVSLAKAAIKVTSVRLVSVDVVSTV